MEKMISKWQEAAIEIAARRFPILGNKNDKTIYISMRDEIVARVPKKKDQFEGWEEINILGVSELQKQPLIDAIMAMDDENFQYNMNGRYVIHIAYSEFKNAMIVDGGTPDFVQSGNSFGPDVEPLMLSIDCGAFIDDNELYEMGGGVPASSDFADARAEAKECGENPDDWIDEIMKVAEENIRASLRSIIIFDDDISEEDDSFDALLINYID